MRKGRRDCFEMQLGGDGEVFRYRRRRNWKGWIDWGCCCPRFDAKDFARSFAIARRDQRRLDLNVSLLLFSYEKSISVAYVGGKRMHTLKYE